MFLDYFQLNWEKAWLTDSFQAGNQGGARGAYATLPPPPAPKGPKGPHFDTQYLS